MIISIVIWENISVQSNNFSFALVPCNVLFYHHRYGNIIFKLMLIQPVSDYCKIRSSDAILLPPLHGALFYLDCEGSLYPLKGQQRST